MPPIELFMRPWWGGARGRERTRDQLGESTEVSSDTGIVFRISGIGRVERESGECSAPVRASRKRFVAVRDGGRRRVVSRQTSPTGEPRGASRWVRRGTTVMEDSVEVWRRNANRLGAWGP